ncbi:MAG: ABC transporter ATP-binding protein [Candidatus Sumerlaeia bacterium]
MIRVVNLHKRFGEKVIYRGLSLHVRRGETHVILGGSGIGKSVLLKHLLGLIEPDEGEIYIDGQRLDFRRRGELLAIRRKMGMLFQQSALFDSMTVGDNVAFYLHEHTRKSPGDIQRLVAEKLRLVNLSNVEHLMPSELSGGMQKRVALARALIAEPLIMLYDEPTTGLDPINADAINDLIISLQERLGMTSIVVTHDMKSAFKVAHRLSMLFDHRIIETGTPEEFQRSANPVVRQFITGSSRGPITADMGAGR